MLGDDFGLLGVGFSACGNGRRASGGIGQRHTLSAVANAEMAFALARRARSTDLIESGSQETHQTHQTSKL